MTIRNILFTTAVATVVGLPAAAYEYTGAVEFAETAGWKHWQEVLLEEGDTSVGRLCNQFVQVLNNPAFTAADCLTASEILSGVTDHDSLPVGQSMWVPHVPFDLMVATPAPIVPIETVTSPTGFLTDHDQLLAAFAAAQPAQLTKKEVFELLQANNTALITSVERQLADLRKQLQADRMADNVAVLTRLAELETAVQNGQSVSLNDTPVAVGPSAADFAALASQINGLVGLQSEMSVVEARLVQVIKDEVSAGLANVASAEAVAELSDQVQVLVDRPVANANQNLLWWLVSLTLTVAVLLGLMWRLRKRSKDIEEEQAAQRTKQTETDALLKAHGENHTATKAVLQTLGKRLDEVEDIQRLLVTRDAQGRFNCPELTEERLNDLPVEESISLEIQEMADGVVCFRVEYQKGKNDDGQPYLIPVGANNPMANQITPKTVRGKEKFTVAQVYAQMDTLIKNQEIIGVTKGREQL